MAAQPSVVMSRVVLSMVLSARVVLSMVVLSMVVLSMVVTPGAAWKPRGATPCSVRGWVLEHGCLVLSFACVGG